MRQASVQVTAMPRLAVAATALVCCAISVAPLAAVFDKMLSAVGLLQTASNPQLAAGIPGDKLWTSLFCLCALATGACIAVLRSVDVSERTRGKAGLSVLLTIGALIALPLIALASLAARWIGIEHGGTQYLDVMLRGMTYWAALCTLALSAALLGSCYRKASQAMLIALLAASSVASAVAVQDYLVTRFAKHVADWREFGTSTPDFFAALLLVTAPVCMGAFLASSKRDTALVTGFCAALQLAALATTGSRFAFVSLGAEVVLFAAGCALVRRGGHEMPVGARSKLITLGIVAVVGGALFAGPLLHRLQAASLRGDANSGAFRVYTWRGAIRLAKAYPVLGAGPDLFQYKFPRYEIAGFTRLAHSGYLQLLDELGPLGLAAMVVIGFGAVAAAGRSLGARREGVDSCETLDHTASAEPLILIGMVSGVLGLLVQNCIDSDWMVTICGATWFAAAGLVLANAIQNRANEMVAEAAEPTRSLMGLRWSAAFCALILAVCCCRWVEGAWQERQGETGAAFATVPLDGDYAGACGMTLASEPASGEAGLSVLTTAARLTPSATAYRRLAEVHQALGNPQAALADLQKGLRDDPNDLALLLMAARISSGLNDGSDALRYYARMAALELSPFGTVPAIGGVAETRFAEADTALAADALRRGDDASATLYALRARRVFNEYLSEGGPDNSMLVEMSGQSSPDAAAALQREYESAMTTLASTYASTGQQAKAAAARSEDAAQAPRFIPKPPAPTR